MFKHSFIGKTFTIKYRQLPISIWKYISIYFSHRGFGCFILTIIYDFFNSDTTLLIEFMVNFSVYFQILCKANHGSTYQRAFRINAYLI